MCAGLAGRKPAGIDRRFTRRDVAGPGIGNGEVAAPDSVPSPCVVEYVPAYGVNSVRELSCINAEETHRPVAVGQAGKQICNIAAELIVGRMPYRNAIQDHSDGRAVDRDCKWILRQGPAEI